MIEGTYRKPIPELSGKSLKTFWSRIHKGQADECWEWIGCLFPNTGYGKFTISTGRPGGKGFLAHRIAWKLTHEDPLDLQVLHRCDNPPCCNPSHLFLGTHSDNMRDKTTKGRGNYTGPKNPRHSEMHYRTKLSNAQVREMRAAYVPHKVTVRDLAKRFGVSYSLSQKILSGFHRKHAL